MKFQLVRRSDLLLGCMEMEVEVEQFVELRRAACERKAFRQEPVKRSPDKASTSIVAAMSCVTSRKPKHDHMQYYNAFPAAE